MGRICAESGLLVRGQLRMAGIVGEPLRGARRGSFPQRSGYFIIHAIIGIHSAADVTIFDSGHKLDDVVDTGISEVRVLADFRMFKNPQPFCPKCGVSGRLGALVAPGG